MNLNMWKNIYRDNVLFVLIDFQEKFFPILKKSVVKLIKANILLLIKMFSQLNIPMIGTEHYVKGLGHTEKDVLKEWGDAPMTDKVIFSCCGDERFLQNLEKYPRPVVVIAGLETHICVLQTVLDLLGRNYQVVVLKDAVVSSTRLKWENGIELMKEAVKYLVKLLKEQQASVD